MVLDLGSSVQHRLFSLDNPMRLVVDIDDAALATDLNKIDLKDTPIENIRSAVRNDNDLRVVFDLSEVVKPRSFALKPIMQYGDLSLIHI